MIEHLAHLIMGIVDAVSDVDERPIARKMTLGCMLVAAILLFVISTLYWQRK